MEEVSEEEKAAWRDLILFRMDINGYRDKRELFRAVGMLCGGHFCFYLPWRVSIRLVTVQPSALLLRNLLIPNRLRRGADSLLIQSTLSYGLCSKWKVLG